MKIKNIIFLFLFFFFSINQANSLEKIVFFDIDYIVSKSNAGIKISEKLKKQNKKNIEFLKKEQKKLQKEIEEIKKVQNIITKDELEKKDRSSLVNSKNESDSYSFPTTFFILNLSIVIFAAEVSLF